MILPQTSRNRESDRLAERVARLEKQLFAAMERIAQLEQENTRLCEENRQLREENRKLREENARLKEQLAAACSSTWNSVANKAMRSASACSSTKAARS